MSKTAPLSTAPIIQKLEDGRGMVLVWQKCYDGENKILSLEVGCDGIEWFYRNRITNELDGTEEMDKLSIPSNKFYERLKEFYPEVEGYCAQD